MATIYDVARMAGVSISTVSHVINQTRYVAEETRARVHRAIEALDYRPSSLARALVRQETKTIAILVPDNVNPFFAELARGIEDHGFAAGYNVMMCNSDRDPAKELAYLDMLISKHVDGLIFMGFDSRIEILDSLVSRSVPVVLFDRDFEHLDAVLLGNYDGGRAATEHLLGLGHRRVACITGPDLATRSGGRVQGYQDALLSAGLPFDERLVVLSERTFAGGRKAAQHLFALADRPTAIFACNDVIAIGAMAWLQSQGLSIPRDISVVGFDDIALSAYVWPPLTTVATPIQDVGAMMCQMLLDRIHGALPPEPQHRKVNHTLLLRGTTAPRNH